ncbi:MAG: TonB-dependent receptor [Sphingosinicella sp.]|nr:TonB-dependent receptor [Sphingosinicella sp.]
MFAPASIAYAQTEEPAAASKDEDAIVVTGARTILPITALPLTVDILGGEELQQQIAVSGSIVDAVSARFPSFSPTREKLSGSGETLRGRSALFAINNVPQSTPIRDGSRDGYTIDPFFIDRVEVIYGSNALQGIGATGGVVNQVTVSAPTEDGVSGRALLQESAQDGFEGDAMGGKAAALVGWKSGAFDLTTGASVERRGVFLDGEGRRIGVDGTQGEIQDSDSWSVFGRLGYQLSGSARIELVANRFELEGNGNYVVLPGNRLTSLPTSSVRGESPGNQPANRAELLSLSLIESDLAGGSLNAQAFFSRTRDIFGGGIFATFQDAALDPTRKLFDQSVNRSRKVGAKLSYERAAPGLENLIVTVGVDTLRDRTAQTLLQTGRQWVPETDFRSIAPFLQGNLKMMDGAVRLVGGLRYENVSLSVPDFTTLAFYGSRRVEGGTPKFDKLLFNGGFVVEPVQGLRGYASYAEGYTIPDVGRVLRGITQTGVRIEDFLDLQPVVSNNREIGLEWNRDALEASVSYFWSSSKLGSLLVRNPDGIFDLVREPIAIEGLEISIAWKTPIQGLTLGGAYTRVEGATDANDDGKYEKDLDGANISPDRMNLYADFGRGPLDARLAMRRYFDRGFNSQPEANDFAGYTLLDAAIGYRLGPQRILASVQNLTDKQYVTYFSDTQGPNDNLRYFTGRGRTFTLTLTSDF